MSGNDVFLPGGGYDFIDGGTGSDLLTYYKPDYGTSSSYVDLAANNYETINGITVDLNATDFTMVKETTTGRLIDLVKGVEQIHATDGNDFIYGSDAAGTAETFYTYGGNDTVYGRNGADTIYAGDGNDTVRPGTGVDVSYGGNGVDYLELYDDGVTANTTQLLQLSESGTMQRSVDNGVTWTDGYNAGGGINQAYEFEGVGLGNSADTFSGNSQDNIINGYGGDDTLNGLGGADTIRGGDGADTINGGDGNDILYGERNNDTINGGAGNDTIYGTAYYAAAEQDKDVIDGGDGTDLANYQNVTQAITVTLNGSTNATVSFAGLANATYADTIKNIENFTGGSGADTITGDANANVLDGWSGKDTIDGGAGNDTVIARNQALEVLNGGADSDTLQLVQNVDFRTTTNNITITNFEALDTQTFTAYMDFLQFTQFNVLKGNGTINLYGTAGNDTLDFTSVDLTAYTGNIYATGGNGNDTFDFTGATFGSTVGTLSLDAGAGTDTLTLGTNDISLNNNYYNTFETLNMSTGSTLTVNGTVGVDNMTIAGKNLTAVADDNSVIFNGLAGNDTFTVDLTNINKVSFDGGAGSDVAILTGTVAAGTTTILGDSPAEVAAFNNIETLRVSGMTITGNIQLDAAALNVWADNSSSPAAISLDVTNNNVQAPKISVVDLDSAMNTTPNPDVAYTSGSPLAVNNTYAVDTKDVGPSVDFNLLVV
jgi:Ca2+-binding RTX toxin-like protein